MPSLLPLLGEPEPVLGLVLDGAHDRVGDHIAFGLALDGIERLQSLIVDTRSELGEELVYLDGDRTVSCFDLLAAGPGLSSLRELGLRVDAIAAIERFGRARNAARIEALTLQQCGELDDVVEMCERGAFPSLVAVGVSIPEASWWTQAPTIVSTRGRDDPKPPRPT